MNRYLVGTLFVAAIGGLAVLTTRFVPYPGPSGTLQRPTSAFGQRARSSESSGLLSPHPSESASALVPETTTTSSAPSLISPQPANTSELTCPAPDWVTYQATATATFGIRFCHPRSWSVSDHGAWIEIGSPDNQYIYIDRSEDPTQCPFSSQEPGACFNEDNFVRDKDFAALHNLVTVQTTTLEVAGLPGTLLSGTVMTVTGDSYQGILLVLPPPLNSYRVRVVDALPSTPHVVDLLRSLQLDVPRSRTQ